MNSWVKTAVFVYVAAVLLFSVTGCKALNNMPLTHLYVIDTDHGICSKRKITDKATLASVWVEDMPIENCDGQVSVTPEEFAKLRVFLRGK